MTPFDSDDFLHELLEPLVANDEYAWLPDGCTGDLTSAPMLGVLGDEIPGPDDTDEATGMGLYLDCKLLPDSLQNKSSCNWVPFFGCPVSGVWHAFVTWAAATAPLATRSCSVESSVRCQTAGNPSTARHPPRRDGQSRPLEAALS